MRPDLPRLLFRTLLVLLPLLAALLLGLWSAHRENALYRTVYGLWDAARTTVDELPNLMGTRPVHFLRRARYEGEGVTRNALGDPPEYVLLSGFFGDDNGVRLMKRDGTIVAAWRLRLSELLPAAQCRNPPATDWNAIPHGTLIAPDGSITVSYESCGMVRIDRCGRKLWATGEITHHSPNALEGGGFVIAGGAFVDGDIPFPFAGPYWEDLLFRFAPDGTLLHRRPATAMFLGNGLTGLITASTFFSPLVDGEFHLNEIEELPAALAPGFPMFAAGDLLWSFRNLNLILVTDPLGERVKWWKTGPWIRQHDPDWGPDGRITVFDNHPDGTITGSRQGGSRIVEVIPATGATRVLYGGTPAQAFFSAERATHQMLPAGHILITEAQAGRAFEVDGTGQVVWEYVNRWEPGWVAWLHDAQVRPRDYFTVADWSCP